MKKVILSITIVIVYFNSYAQTNTFPTSGSVGIGTTVPASNLQIRESTDSKPGGIVAPTKSIIKLSRIGTGNYSYNESAEFRIGHGGPSLWGSQLDLFLNGSTNQTDIPDQQVMTWLYNGYVGIGTTTPKSTLHLMGSFITGGGNANLDPASPVSIPNTLANSGQMLIGWNRQAGAGETDFIANQGAGFGGGFAFYNHDNSNNEALLMYITGGGNVGIGTINPLSYKLAVNGSAIATSMTVKAFANWPDYVFKKEYQLPSLTDVKTYIDQNHHLPEMPSAQQIEKDGLNLGEINKLLVKKVEELTLYLIEKDKNEKNDHSALNEQKQKILNQEQRIKLLETKLDQLLKTNY
jgi:hypothetical protein